jgi:serine protease AprX
MSWGAEFNFYTTQARNFDQFVYENDDFLILVAAGNSGAGDAANSVGSPATAKNVIAVGSHHSWGSSNPPGSLGPAYVSDFSSRGPTSDGRMKPDVLAVGHAVLSAGGKSAFFCYKLLHILYHIAEIFVLLS